MQESEFKLLIILKTLYIHVIEFNNLVQFFNIELILF